MYPALANSKINKLHDFICYVLHPRWQDALWTACRWTDSWLHHTPTRFIWRTFGLSPFHWKLLSHSRAQLFVSFSSDTLRHANVTLTAQYMIVLLPPYTKLASLRDVGVNAGFCGTFSNRLNFRILVKGENVRSGRNLCTPSDTRLVVAIQRVQIGRLTMLPAKPWSARRAFLVVIFILLGSFFDLIWKRHFSSDTILIHITDMFIFETILHIARSEYYLWRRNYTHRNSTATVWASPAFRQWTLAM